jgi:hypothetical protein
MHYVWQNTNWTEFRWKSDALIQPLGRIYFLGSNLDYFI